MLSLVVLLLRDTDGATKVKILEVHGDMYLAYSIPYLSFLVPVKNEFVTTISPAVHLK